MLNGDALIDLGRSDHVPAMLRSAKTGIKRGGKRGGKRGAKRTVNTLLASAVAPRHRAPHGTCGRPLEVGP